jgi:hypothetical protein
MYAKRQKAVLAYLMEQGSARPIEIGTTVFGPVPKAYRAAPVCQNLLDRGLLRCDSSGRYSLVEGNPSTRFEARPLPAVIDRCVSDAEDALLAFEKLFHRLADYGDLSLSDEAEMRLMTEAAEKARSRLRHHVHGWIAGTMSEFRGALAKMSDVVGRYSP